MEYTTKKMSKSDETGKGVIFLSDSPEAAAKKIVNATSDDKARVAFDRANQPGISNLLEILALIRKHENLDQVIAEFEGVERYGDFKRIVATEVSDELRKFQQNLAEVDDTVIMNKLTTSEAAMREQASETLLRVQQAVGLRPQA
jgi:tryptophanyl-tRNA synthetase